MWSTTHSFRAATLSGRSSLRCTDFYVHGSGDHYACGGENNLQEAVLSSNHTGPGDWTRVTRLGCQHPDQLRHLTEPSLLFLSLYVLDKRFLCKAETKQKVWTFLLETRSGYTDPVCTNAGLHGIPPAHSCGLTLHAPKGSVPPYATLSTLPSPESKAPKLRGQPSVSCEESHLRRDSTPQNYRFTSCRWVAAFHLYYPGSPISWHAALRSLSALTQKQQRWSKSTMPQGPLAKLRNTTDAESYVREVSLLWLQSTAIVPENTSADQGMKSRTKDRIPPCSWDQSKSGEPALH